MDGYQDTTGSPFHKGEQAVQERLGLRDQLEAFGRRVIRDHMPDQHREFYAMLPFLLVGTLDDRGRPWASIVAGRHGFISSPDARTLTVAGRPPFGDPLNMTLRAGADIGVLGIQLETRRRNRLSGRIESVGPDSFTIGVRQAFGNCPQYIQTRTTAAAPEIGRVPAERPVSRSDWFDDGTRALIERSDTLFIATAYSDGSDAESGGVDVSHRGGKPGFVRVEGDRSFVFPDFSGNNHFNTVGNIVMNPKAGFLFADFETGDVVYLTGEAEIVWDGAEVRAFAGAERLIRFRADEVIRVEASLPLSFGFGDYSPMLQHTGSWAQAAETLAAEAERDTFVPYEVFDVRPESETIKSFYLRRADGKAPAGHDPGQFLPIRLGLSGTNAPVTRTYTVSDAPNGDYFRLSVKREGGDALVSTYLHDQVRPGHRIEAMAPRGTFVLDQSSDRPAVLISAGVGITPMIAIANFAINEGLRTRKFRPIHFIHGARSGRTLAFGDHIRSLAARHDRFQAHIRFSRPEETDRQGVTHDSTGHVDIALLKALLPFDDYDFYLCGPAAFMQSLYDGLTALGVREARIHYESFGTATVLRASAGVERPSASREAAHEPVAVRFSTSEVDAEWTPASGTLLELAEAAGLAPPFSCRSGICGTCATKLQCGAVDYIDAPIGPHGDDEVLICCSTPRSVTGEASCGKDHGVVLDL